MDCNPTWIIPITGMRVMTNQPQPTNKYGRARARHRQRPDSRTGGTARAAASTGAGCVKG